MTDQKQLVKLEFVSFCIEQYKKAANMGGCEVEQLFSQRGVTSSLFDNYQVQYNKTKKNVGKMLMNQPKITQENVHLLLPNKVAQLADRLIQNGVVANMPTAVNMVYTSPVYANMERENTKYWWFSVNALYQEVVHQ